MLPPNVPTDPSAGDSQAEFEEINLLALVNVLLRRWKLVVALPVLAGGLAVLYALRLPPMYVAKATFVPEDTGPTGSLGGALAGVAAQFGFGGAGSGTSPRFYADLIRSRTLLDSALHTRIPDRRAPPAGDSAMLQEVLASGGQTAADMRFRARKSLEGMLAVNANNETNVVTVQVRSRNPALSADVANLFLALVNHFNLETRQTRAALRRTFTQQRVDEAVAELEQAEDSVKRFLERNVRFTNSPQLSFEYERLQRQVRIKEEVLTTLRREYETARIEEVNDTPVITVIEQAVTPERKSGPRRRLIVMVGVVLGGMFSVIAAFAGEFAQRARQRQDQDYREFTSRWSQIGNALRAVVPPWRA